MSPEKAKAFLVEDDWMAAWRTKNYLEKGGHSVLLEATTLEEALALVPRLEQEGVNVAVVDGNLSKEGKDGADGRKVVEAIRGQAPNIKIVVYSRGDYNYGDEGVPKPRFSPEFKDSDRSPKIEEVVREI